SGVFAFEPFDGVRLPSTRFLIAREPPKVFCEPEHRCDRELSEGLREDAARVGHHDTCAAQQVERKRLDSGGERMNPADALRLWENIAQLRAEARSEQDRLGFANVSDRDVAGDLRELRKI